MGTITERTTKDGKIRYRATIRINKDGVKYSESRTFSKKNLAQNWLKKREAETYIKYKLMTYDCQKQVAPLGVHTR